MSDTEEVDPILERQNEAATAYLRSTYTALPCPVCANKGWTFIDSFGHTTVLSDDEGRTLATFAFCCNQCGYTQQHVRWLVAAYVEAMSSKP